MLRVMRSLVTVVLLAIAISSPAASQNPVLDTDGNPVQSGVQYYVLPGVTDVAGGLTLVRRTDQCPLYVGQEPLAPVVSSGLPVIFTPFATGESIIREGRDTGVQFDAASVCVQSTAWRVGPEDPDTNRRFIVTGGERGYFRIDNNGGIYNLGWCPSESCPNCRPRCGSAGILVQNGTRFLQLDGDAFPFVFRRA
ncbi:alpha-amylase/subtilisin inhibitor-like [Punica granatum]|uniref:Alpha-amylase/subtilisin inhibitor-like n=1 Tax=Punica granatum TaxID=22663 RepID=A0A6P8C9Q6_PUNGR|nr:alpha-amylase/subtilisin inhibitor-like [Punica granatum]